MPTLATSSHPLTAAAAPKHTRVQDTAQDTAQSTAQPLSLAATVAAALAPHVSRCFGLMGNGNAYFLDYLVRTHVKFVPVRHEAGSIAAADGYYRASGRIAIATTTYGAGFTNAITPLAEAVQANIPVLVVVGDEPSAGARPWDVQQEAVATAVGARTFKVGPDNAAETAIAALQYALEFRTPAILALPYDLAQRPVSPQVAPPLVLPEPVAPQADAVASAAAVLATAQRPHILVGRGAHLSGASELVGELADILGATTSSTALGRGLAPRTEFDLGVTGGFGQPEAMKHIRASDVVVVVGAGMNQFTMSFGHLLGPDATVIQIDLAAQATHPAVTHFVRGDAAVAVRELIAQLRAKGAVAAAPRAGSSWRDVVVSDEGDAPKAVYTVRDDGTEAADGRCADGRLDPRALARRLDQVLPVNRYVVSDGGHFLGWSNTRWSVRSPERVCMVGTAYQSIGLGLLSAIGVGAAVAESDPEATVVVTSGDGGALMALSDLGSAIAAMRRGIIVIWNDAVYAAEVHIYGVLGLDPEPMTIGTTDFAGHARAAGAEAAVITQLNDLAGLEEFVASGREGVYVCDCRISTSVVAEYMSEILEKATLGHVPVQAVQPLQ